MPLPCCANTLTNPCVNRSIFALGLVASGSMTARAATREESTSFWVIPTVAISGEVKTLALTTSSRSGATASPRACHMAMRPCIAATEASGRTPVQSPAAYTPRTDVRDTPSTSMWPDSVRPIPFSAKPIPAV